MSAAKKFGTFAGVYTPSVLTILGVIMYLRMGWVVGSGGLWGTIAIIFIAHIISVSTGLSVSSMATDKKIKAGGIYYLLSRSLGLPIGGAIGITLFFGTALSIALYLIGFAEVFNEVLGLGNDINDFRITGSISLAAIAIIAYISTSIAIKTQFIIFGAIILSLISIFFGSVDGVNLVQNTSELEIPSFEVIFGIFFPAVTGFTAGVAMSGDLKNPKKNIPTGTLLAIATGLIVYLALATFIYFKFFQDHRATLLGNNNLLVEMAWIPQLVIAGVWGATLSSALGGILGAPRILQALALDKIGPKAFSIGVGKDNEPRNALILTFIIAEAGILIGQLDAIAEIVSMFYLAAYGFINLAALLESWASSDFRPSLKIPKWIAIIGIVFTFGVMFRINMIAMLVSLVIIMGIFFYLTKKQITIGSGDVWHSVWTSIVKAGLKKIEGKQIHKRNWEPNILLFSQGTNYKDRLIEFSKVLSGRMGLISHIDLIENPTAEIMLPKTKMAIDDKEFKEHGIFARRQECKNFYNGIETIASTYGFSGVEPNTILMGWERNNKDPEKFAHMTRTLVSLDYNVLYLDYDLEKGFGAKKTIDLWWSVNSRNADLTISLVKFIQASSEWSNATLRVLNVNNSTTPIQIIENNIKKFLDTHRVSAEIKVIENNIEQRSLYDVAKIISVDSDLIIMGIPPVKKGNESSYVQNVNSMLDVLGTTLLVKASSNFEDLPLLTSSTDDTFEEESNISKERTIPTTQLTLSRHDNLNLEVENLNLALDKLYDVVLEEMFPSLFDLYKTQYNEDNNKLSILTTEDFDNSFKKIKNTLGKELISLKSNIDIILEDVSENIKLPLNLDDCTIRARDTQEEKWKKKVTKFKLNIGLKPKNKINLRRIIKFEIDTHYYDLLKKYVNQIGLLGFKLEHELLKAASSKEKNSYDDYIKNLEVYKQNISVELVNLNRRFSNLILRDLKRINIEEEKEEEFLNYRKKRNETLSYLDKFANNWYNNQKLFHENTLTDYNLIQLNNKVISIINESEQILSTELFEMPYNTLEKTQQSIKNNTTNQHISFEELINIQMIEELLSSMEMQLLELVDKLPGKVSGFDEDTFNNFRNDQSESLSIRNIPLNKLIESKLENSLITPIQKELKQVPYRLKAILNRVEQTFKLYHIESIDDAAQLSEDQRNELLEKLDKDVEKANNQLSELKEKVTFTLRSSENEFANNLSTRTLLNNPIANKVVIRTERKLPEWFTGFKKINDALKDKYENLLTRISERKTKKITTYTEEQSDISYTLKKFIQKKSVNHKIVNKLPFYYRQLFIGKHFIESNLINLNQEELEKVEDLIEFKKEGARGAILIVGMPNSGKSFVSKKIGKELGSKKTIRIHAPIQGSTKVQDLERALQKGSNISNLTSNELLSKLPSNTVIIINDLELWWERSRNGTRIIELLVSWIEGYPNICFVINCSTFSYQLINKLSGLSNHILGKIELNNLNYSELFKIIIDRHKTTGIKFKYKGYDEDNLPANQLTKLFRLHFEASRGIIGDAFQNWIASIDHFDNNVITISDPFTDHLPIIKNQNWLLVLSQIILHKNVNTQKLIRIFGRDKTTMVRESISGLLKCGVLEEIRIDVYRVNPLIVNDAIQYLHEEKLV